MKGISNEWWREGKLIASPNKQYAVGVFYIYDTNGFQSSLVLFDKDNKELKRHLIYKYAFDRFLIEGISWRNNTTFFITFTGQRKQFSYTVHDFLKSKVKIVSAKTLEASN